jgi:competence protein ComEA
MPRHPVVVHVCAAILASLLSCAAAARAEPTPVASAASAAQLGAGTVNLNTASAEELERLPGIGPSRARAILALRAQLTRFKRLEELLRVKGIGRATFRRLRPLVTLQGETTLSEPTKHSR